MRKPAKCVLRIKAIRNTTAIGKGSVSVGSVAVQLACNIFDTLYDKTVVLVGAGEICELAGDHFFDYSVGEIIVANRSLENAERLALRNVSTLSRDTF